MEFKEGEESSKLEITEDLCKFSIYSNLGSEVIAARLRTFWTSSHFNHSSSKDQFIWHSGFPPKINLIDPSTIQGTLNYGESIQDEWFLVWCLFQISSQFDCEICVSDSDGEFMLIEAAEVLPKWVTPSVAEGRVWIKSGSLHLIPPESTCPVVQGKLSSKIALQLLRGMPTKTVAPRAVNTAVTCRVLSASPEELSKSHLFNTKAYLHCDIAKSLKNDPNLIGLAVKAFWDKDADSYKACQSMVRFPPYNPATSQTHLADLSNQDSHTVLFNLRMTRPLYAMLLNHQINFYPPKPFEKVNWSLNGLSENIEWKRRSVGMKIQCGFEMMFCDLASKSHGSESRFDTSSQRYKLYLSKLQSSNYFEGEIEGSERWKELEKAARVTYLRTRKPSDEVARRFEQSLSSESNIVFSKEGTIDFEEESDDWLELDEEKLKEIFKDGNRNPSDSESSDAPHTEEEKRMARADVQKMTTFASSVEKFVEGKGSLEGALHSDDELSNEDEDSEMSDYESTDSQEEVMLKENNGNKRKVPKWARGTKNGKYTDEMKKRLETIVPAIGDAEWGQKPDNDMASATESADCTLKKTLFKTDKGKARETQVPNHLKEITNSSSRKKTKLPRFSQESYDGVCNESSGESSDNNDWLKSCGETGSRDCGLPDDVDMYEEREEFLNFAREALGLTKEQYETILDSRRDRGAYVPPPLPVKQEAICGMDDDSETGDDENLTSEPLRRNDGPINISEEIGPRKKQVHFQPPVESAKPEKLFDASRPVNLEAFDTLMDRMEAELSKQIDRKATKTTKGGPIGVNEIGPDLMDREEDMSESGSEMEMDEVTEAMQRELGELMKKSGVDLEGKDNGQINYGLIGDFLESFTSQAGLPGPVGNIAGRIGVDLLGKDEKKNMVCASKDLPKNKK
ncbi:SGT1 protein-domain-containing protein [Phakopsora pachyrhizi]|uniref:SGT1 protein-domain-containing protein n=1 Tax=Phakopsora pachyrhizi TaxID=170000 RepID=A0AAV0BID3_PHAPC|nr:SGT1 protein-domain-containing protein [Phakopsora pachyrhizi]CAH7685701.1 SGT1 protein-domain-containing protein [Phakopsora pachyrhizi]